MNGPQLVCAGCGEPTTMFKPICDSCAGSMGEVRICHECSGSGESGTCYDDGSPRPCGACRGDGHLEK